MGGGGGECCQTFSFVLFSLFSRPRAGLATVQSSFFGLATNTLNVRNNNNNNNNLGISFVLISVQCVALRILDLLIKTGWSEFFP